MPTCRKCDFDFDDAAVPWCPRCGVPDPLSDAAAAKRVKRSGGGILKWFLAGGAFLLFLVFGVGSLGGQSQQGKDRRVYELCLSDLESADRARNGNATFIAGVCEKLRTEYVNKYGHAP